MHLFKLLCTILNMIVVIYDSILLFTYEKHFLLNSAPTNEYATLSN